MEMTYMVKQTWTQLQLQTVLSESLSPLPNKTMVNATSPQISQVATPQAKKPGTVNAKQVS